MYGNQFEKPVKWPYLNKIVFAINILSIGCPFRNRLANSVLSIEWLLRSKVYPANLLSFWPCDPRFHIQSLSPAADLSHHLLLSVLLFFLSRDPHFGFCWVSFHPVFFLPVFSDHAFFFAPPNFCSHRKEKLPPFSPSHHGSHLVHSIIAMVIPALCYASGGH